MEALVEAEGRCYTDLRPHFWMEATNFHARFERLSVHVQPEHKVYEMLVCWVIVYVLAAVLEFVVWRRL